MKKQQSTLEIQETRNLRKTIGRNTVISSNVKRSTKENMNRKYLPWNGRKNLMFCRQIKITTSFTSYKNKKAIKIFHNLTSKNTLWSVFDVNYVMWENEEQHLIYTLIITGLTYLMEMPSPHVVILPKKNIDLTCKLYID